MRHPFLSSFSGLATVCLCAFLSAQAPTLVVLEPTLDLGVVKTSETKVFKFTLHNTGKTPVKLDAIRPTCGCTAVALAKMLLEPDEKLQIEAGFAGKGFSGHVTKGIEILSDDAARRRFTWNFTADVVPLVTVQRGQIGLFVEESTPGEVRYQLLLQNRPSSPLKVVAVEFAGSSPILLSNTYTQKGLEVEGVIAYDPKKQAQASILEARGANARFNLTLKFEGGESESVPMLFSVKAPYTVNPRVTVLEGDAGREMKSRATVSALEPFEATSVSSSHKAIQATLIPIPESGGKAVGIEIIVEAGIAPGRLAEMITVKTNNTKIPTIPVPVFILVRPSSK